MIGLAGLAVAAAAIAALVVLRRRLGEERAAVDRSTRDAAAAAHAAHDAEADADRLRRALDVVPQAVVVWDGEGEEVFRNVAGQEFEDARHADAIVAQTIDDLLRSALLGKPGRRDLDLFGPPRRVLTVTAMPIASRSRSAAAVVEDVSERRRLEGIRRDFVANVSHELKTPIGALGVLAEAIVAEDELAVIRRLAERMTGEAIRVGRIIDDLLALSRIEAEEEPARVPVRVTELIGDAVDRVRSLAEANGIAIGTVGVDPAHTVWGDRLQLTSALANLLENACKYSDPGAGVDVSSSADGPWVEVRVADHGIGIPARDLERVFERFYRVDRARSRQTGGTGLGLAIVRHVASSHGGDVRLTSNEGVGSTFTLRLPAGTGDVAPTASSTQEVPTR